MLISLSFSSNYLDSQGRCSILDQSIIIKMPKFEEIIKAKFNNSIVIAARRIAFVNSDIVGISKAIMELIIESVIIMIVTSIIIVVVVADQFDSFSIY